MGPFGALCALPDTEPLAVTEHRRYFPMYAVGGENCAAVAPGISVYEPVDVLDQDHW